MNKTAIIVLLKNTTGNNLSVTLADFRRFVKKYLGTSRYIEDENDGSEDPINGIVIKGFLSDEEKKELIDYNENNVIPLFLEQNEDEPDVIDDKTYTIISPKTQNENN